MTSTTLPTGTGNGLASRRHSELSDRPSVVQNVASRQQPVNRRPSYVKDNGGTVSD
jgi:hypothetical protein